MHLTKIGYFFIESSLVASELEKILSSLVNNPF